jgi:hypothetical protein
MEADNQNLRRGTGDRKRCREALIRVVSSHAEEPGGEPRQLPGEGSTPTVSLGGSNDHRLEIVVSA